MKEFTRVYSKMHIFAKYTIPTTAKQSTLKSLFCIVSWQYQRDKHHDITNIFDSGIRSRSMFINLFNKFVK